MPKIFRSSVEANFFPYLSKIWDRLPLNDREMLVEYWRGLIRSTSDDYFNMLQAEGATGLLTISPFEVRKWRPIEIRRIPDFLDLEEATVLFPSGKVIPYHAEGGILRVEHLYASLQSVHFPISPTVEEPKTFTFDFEARVVVSDASDVSLFGYFSGEEGRDRKSSVALSIGRIDSSSFDTEQIIVSTDTVSSLSGITGPGLLSEGSTPSNDADLSVLEPLVLRDSSISPGGQVAVSVPAGTYSGVLLRLATPPDEATRQFQVYRSPSNAPGTYERVTEGSPAELSDIGGGDFELKFSIFGIEFSEGEWIKIRPEDPGTEFTFSDIDNPMAITRSSSRLKEDWAILSEGSEMGLRVIISDKSGLYSSIRSPMSLSETELDGIIGDFNFSDYHQYRMDVTDSTIEVFVDGASVFSDDFESKAPREFGGFGEFSLEGGSGFNLFFKNVHYTSFNVDERIAELPALYDRYEVQTVVMEEGQDYSLPKRGVLEFESLADIRDLDVMIAEYVSFALRRIETSYGLLVDVFGEDSPELKQKTISVWSSLLDGPLLESIKKGVQGFLGLPITLNDGFVTQDTSSDTSIEIDGIKFDFLSPVGPGINPNTGDVFKKGDFVPAFSALAGGVIVRDIYVKKDWWHPILGVGLHELQKYHLFEIEIEESLFTEDVSSQDVFNFLDRIRTLGDNFFIVAKSDVTESLVIESNTDRNALLDEEIGDPRRVFIGDSSDPAEICFPFVTNRDDPNLFGFSAFGDLSVDQVADEDFAVSLNITGFGDPDEAFVDFSEIVSGSLGTTNNLTGNFTVGDSDLSSVRSGDLLLIFGGANEGVYVISEVLTTTDLLINTTTDPFPSSSVGNEYQILRVLLEEGGGLAFISSGGYRIREGSSLRVQADDNPEALILVGVNPEIDPLLPPFVQPEELLNALTFSDGSSRIPGATSSLELLKADARDLPLGITPPRRVCIRTNSSRGINSKLIVGDTDGAFDLQIIPGEFVGHMTYPGADGEPPYTEAEREQALILGGPGDPGLSFDADIFLDDGFTIRRDIQAVLKNGKVVGFEHVDSSRYNELETGQPYQAPFEKGAQFGTFFSDYVTPRPEYPLIDLIYDLGSSSEIIVGRIFGSTQSGSTDFIALNANAETNQPAGRLRYLSAGDTGTLLAPDLLKDTTQDFSFVRAGDRVIIRSAAGFLSAQVIEILPQKTLKLGVNRFPLPGVPSPLFLSPTFIETPLDIYIIQGLPTVGDILFITSGEKAGCIFEIAELERNTSPILAEQIANPDMLFRVFEKDADGNIIGLLEFEDTDAEITFKVLRPPLPYALNTDAIPLGRVSKTALGYNPLAGDLKPVEDAFDIDIFHICAPTTVKIGGVEFSAFPGDRIRMTDHYDGTSDVPVLTNDGDTGSC